jgi:hypothetical protein
LNKSQVAALLLALPLIGCVQAPATKPSQTEIAPAGLGLGGEAAPQPQCRLVEGIQRSATRSAGRAAARQQSHSASALARIRAAEAEVSSRAACNIPTVNIDGTDTLQLVSKEVRLSRRATAAPGNGWAMSRRAALVAGLLGPASGA